MGIFQLTLLLVGAVIPDTGRRRLEAVALLMAGSLLGFLPTGGFWAWVLYQRFGNPVFPLANGLFRSEMFSPQNFGSKIYVTQTLGDLLRPVVDTALGRPARLQEIPLRDLRLAVLAGTAVRAEEIPAAKDAPPAVLDGERQLRLDVPPTPAPGRSPAKVPLDAQFLTSPRAPDRCSALAPPHVTR